MMNPEDLSIAAAASAIRDASLSPVDYVRALLGRIDALEPRIQAWVIIDREAVLAEAKQREAEARKKRLRGSLHGVPVGIKDIFYTKGLKTSMGSVLFKDFIPNQDARAVAKLKEAGAIVLGKTVTTQFAYLDPGATRNPWNIAHTPGGSSSGSAAAVAARMCPAAIGTQTVGSVGRPSAFCGIVSLMPSRQRISLQNVFPMSWSLDHAGVFARSVADVQLMFNAVAEVLPEKTSRKQRVVRIGLLRGFFYDNATAEMRTSYDTLANKLATAGFHVHEARLPEIFEIHQPILRTILRSEAASVHDQLFGEHASTYGPRVRALIETGMLVEAADYLRAKRLRRKYQREMARLFENADVLMTPAARGTAPKGLETTGDAMMNGPWTLSDFPTMTLPLDLCSDEMPIGVQLTGPPLHESDLLDIAARIEPLIGWAFQPSNR
jgi:aspartyl-tRNA(Asn)/glutamyl-tRNA(Gln) amidotransferase subunit A